MDIHRLESSRCWLKICLISFSGNLIQDISEGTFPWITEALITFLFSKGFLIVKNPAVWMRITKIRAKRKGDFFLNFMEKMNMLWTKTIIKESPYTPVTEANCIKKIFLYWL